MNCSRPHVLMSPFSCIAGARPCCQSIECPASLQWCENPHPSRTKPIFRRPLMSYPYLRPSAPLLDAHPTDSVCGSEEQGRAARPAWRRCRGRIEGDEGEGRMVCCAPRGRSRVCLPPNVRLRPSPSGVPCASASSTQRFDGSTGTGLTKRRTPSSSLARHAHHQEQSPTSVVVELGCQFIVVL